MWIAFSFGSALFAGVTAVIAKIGIKNVNSTVATALRTIIILIFSWLLVFITDTFQGIKDIPGKTLLFLILSGLATGGSWLCYFKALQLGDVNKVTPIDKSSTILTMLLAFIILGEKLSPIKIICMLLIGAGTYLMITKHSDKNTVGKGWLIYAVLSAFFASLTSILGKIGISGIDSNLGTAIRTVVVLIMAWVMVFVTGKQKEIKEITKSGATFICISGLTTGMSWLCYYKALQDGPASVVVPIDKLSILVTIIFSYFILKERLTKKALAGLAMITLGTLLLVI